jgi:hypothetical protein
MSDAFEFDDDHSLEGDQDQYACIKLTPNWLIMVHPEGDIGLKYVPDPQDPEGKEYAMDIGFTEYSSKQIIQILSVMRTGGVTDVIH